MPVTPTSGQKMIFIFGHEKAASISQRLLLLSIALEQPRILHYQTATFKKSRSPQLGLFYLFFKYGSYF
jgi:hypothetical protein